MRSALCESSETGMRPPRDRRSSLATVDGLLYHVAITEGMGLHGVMGFSLEAFDNESERISA